jgi:hypothetical protein
LRNYHSVVVIAFLSVLAGSPAHAETDLTGKWTGMFSGVQVEFPPQRGPFGQTKDDGKKGPSAPEERPHGGNLDRGRIQATVCLRTGQLDDMELRGRRRASEHRS